jgi:hypothetical protein
MAKLFALGICVLALYFFISDYAFATVARMTNDPSWLTESYKRDRVLNGMEFSAKPYEDSSGNVYLHVTYVNPTRYSYTLKDVMMDCGGINGGRIEVVVPITSHEIPARSVVDYTLATSKTDMVKMWKGNGHFENNEWVYDGWGCSIDF